MSKTYAGIGSRTAPAIILREMSKVACYLERKGYHLHSGGAEGADTAFETGVTDSKNKSIFLPWPGFNKRYSKLNYPSKAAFQIAEAHHPAWDRCRRGARLLHARNSHQVLGEDLESPVDFVLCWAPLDAQGKPTGGTSQALRIADTYKIPYYIVVEDMISHLAELGVEGEDGSN